MHEDYVRKIVHVKAVFFDATYQSAMEVQKLFMEFGWKTVIHVNWDGVISLEDASEKPTFRSLTSPRWVVSEEGNRPSVYTEEAFLEAFEVMPNICEDH